MAKLKEYLELYNNGMIPSVEAISGRVEPQKAKVGPGFHWSKEDVIDDPFLEDNFLLPLFVQDIELAPINVQEAYKRLGVKNYDYMSRNEEVFDNLNKDDLDLVLDYLYSLYTKNEQYSPGKDYYALRAYYGDDLHSPYMDTKGENHELGKTYRAKDDSNRDGYSINGLRKNLYDIGEGPESIRRIINNSDDQEVKREILQEAIKKLNDTFDNDNNVKHVVVSTKGRDIDTRDAYQTAKEHRSVQRDSGDEYLVKHVTPIEIVDIPDYIELTEDDIKNEAAKHDMSVDEFKHSKEFVKYLRENGLALDDLDNDNSIIANRNRNSIITNRNSRARKVVDKLYMRGYDNILSDEHLKIKERFL